MRYLASTCRRVWAVFDSYEALVQHFEKAKNDKTRAKKEKYMYEELERKTTSKILY
jgi:hypothetical protein